LRLVLFNSPTLPRLKELLKTCQPALESLIVTGGLAESRAEICYAAAKAVVEMRDSAGRLPEYSQTDSVIESFIFECLEMKLVGARDVESWFDDYEDPMPKRVDVCFQLAPFMNFYLRPSPTLGIVKKAEKSKESDEEEEFVDE